MQEIVAISHGVTRHPDYRLQPVDLTLLSRQPAAICGLNGSGKSSLVDIITGAHPLQGDEPRYRFRTSGTDRSSRIRHITFRDVYGGAAPQYYQQRWNKGDEATFPTVRALLLHEFGRTALTPADLSLLSRIGVTANLDREVNTLSSGELRRFQICKALVARPELLIVDNPYIGLDSGARGMLTSLLEQIAQELTLVIVVSRPEDIPAFIKTVIPVSEKHVLAPVSREAYVAHVPGEKAETPKLQLPFSNDSTLAPNGEDDSIVELHNVNLSYDGRKILHDLSWTVKRGEHWAVTGENGAGKTTLLSLICADNPMAYARSISLFGKRRGHGESIWDIKKRIGYVSPEIYSTYKKDLPAIDIVASGLYDTIGIYRRISEEDKATSREWLRAFCAEDLADHPYLKLSSGEQRLILLIRAFVKQPDLLVLDEPFHGLDNKRRQRAREIIDAYMTDPRKTLIMISHYEEEFPHCIDQHLHLKKHH